MGADLKLWNVALKCTHVLTHTNIFRFPALLTSSYIFLALGRAEPLLFFVRLRVVMPETRALWMLLFGLRNILLESWSEKSKFLLGQWHMWDSTWRPWKHTPPSIYWTMMYQMLDILTNFYFLFKKKKIKRIIWPLYLH